MTGQVKWVKITTNMFDDEKIRIIESMPESDSILIIWIKLLTLAGKVNANGFIFLTENIPYTDEMLSSLFQRPLNTIRLALETFKRFNMIHYSDSNMLYILNREKHQNIDGLEKIRQQGKQRIERYREKQKEIDSECNVTSNVTERYSNVNPLSLSLILDNVTNIDTTVTIEGEENQKTEEKPKKKGNKKKYAENVLLLEQEYETLCSKITKEGADRCIEILHLYKGSSGKKYASDYMAILSWVVKSYQAEIEKARASPAAKKKKELEGVKW